MKLDLLIYILIVTSLHKNSSIGRAVFWGGGKGHHFLSLDYLSSTSRFFFRPRRFFSFFPQCGTWSQAKFCPVEILGK